MPQRNPYGAYERANVQTADQRRLILMMYDGAIRFMQKGAQRIEVNDVEAAHNYLVRARNVVSELLSTLRPEKAGEMGENLKRLYVYIFNRLVEANLTKDKSIVDESIRLMDTLREGWSSMKPAAEIRPESEDGPKRHVDVRS